VGRGLIGGRDSDVIELAASFSSCDTGSRRWGSCRVTARSVFSRRHVLCARILLQNPEIRIDDRFWNLVRS
jgi:hypothetical protein